MQTLKLYTEDAGDGFVNFVVEGSPDAFQWLIAASGNARDGFNANWADTTDDLPRRLVLVPETPNAPRDQLPKSRTAHLTVDNPKAKASAHIPIDAEAHQAIPDEIRAELHQRGIRWAVKEPEPDTSPHVEAVADHLANRGGGPLPAGSQPVGGPAGDHSEGAAAGEAELAARQREEAQS